MHLDATGVPVLDRAAPGGKRIGSLWCYVGDDVCAYVYASTGKARGQQPGEMGPEDILALREGYTVADAASLFDASFAARPNLIECGCNMHSRRYCVKALEAGDTRAALPIAAYKKLYEIEDEICDRDPDAKLATRREHSRPVFDELLAGAEVHQPFEAPSSKLGEAIRYLLNHRSRSAASSSPASCPLITAKSRDSTSEPRWLVRLSYLWATTISASALRLHSRSSAAAGSSASTLSSTSPMCFRGSPVPYGSGVFQSYCRIAGRRVATLRRHSARHSLNSRADAPAQPDVADVDAATGRRRDQPSARPGRKAAESIAPASRKITWTGVRSGDRTRASRALVDRKSV